MAFSVGHVLVGTSSMSDREAHTNHMQMAAPCRVLKVRKENGGGRKDGREGGGGWVGGGGSEEGVSSWWVVRGWEEVWGRGRLIGGVPHG